MKKQDLAYEMLTVSTYICGGTSGTLQSNDYYTAHRINELLKKMTALLDKAEKAANMPMEDSELEAFYMRSSQQAGISNHFANSNWRSILLEINSRLLFYGTRSDEHTMQKWSVLTLRRWCLLLKSCFVEQKIRSY
jgi:hypothetical protein